MCENETKRYKWRFDDDRVRLVCLIRDYLNEIWYDSTFMDIDKKWGTEQYYRRLPFRIPMINHRSEEEYIISDWVESLDDKYHNLFPNVGEKLQITYHHRNGEYKNVNTKKWDKYRRTFNRILKELTFDGKIWYDDEERLVMNLFREFFMMYKDLEWFNYWKLNLKEKWGYTEFISEWE